MKFGNKPVDGGNLLIGNEELKSLGLNNEQKNKFIKKIVGSAEVIKGIQRYCIWIEDNDLEEASNIIELKERIEAVKKLRLKSKDKSANKMAERAHQMREMYIGKNHTIVIPGHSSESRNYLPVEIVDKKTTVSNAVFALYDAPIWCISLIASTLHLIWIKTVCGQLETRIRYSNTIGWNNFPLPLLTTKNKVDLTICAEEILIARERHFPATIADLYDPEKIPEDLRQAHDRNDEVLERIYIGRRFKNDTERLEKLFELYTQMTLKEKAV